jgi:hypothetical protein
MGCGCKGDKATTSTAKDAEVKTAPPVPKRAPKPPLLNSGLATTGKSQSFSLRLRDGSTFTFGSRLEAEAENVRQGYTGTVRSS